MATVSSIDPNPAQEEQRARSEVRFAARNLADSLAVAREIHAKGGGKATGDQLAAFLGYKSTTNGAYLSRVGAARTFGLITKSGDFFVLTPLSIQILSPTYPEQAKEGLITAFMNVELYRKVYEEFKGRELPPEFGMKNALRNIFKIVPARVDLAYRTLMDSAQDAGFFDTRGSRTHLIMPMVKPLPATTPQVSAADDEASAEFGGGSDGGGGDGSDGGGNSGHQPQGKAERLLTRSMDAVKAQYIATLIKVFEEKSKDGELDEKLMERIEKLLN